MIIAKVRTEGGYWNDDSRIAMYDNLDDIKNIKGGIESIKLIKDGKYKCVRCNGISNGIDWDKETINANGGYNRYTSITEVPASDLSYYSFYCPCCKQNTYGRIDIVEKSNTFRSNSL